MTRIRKILRSIVNQTGFDIHRLPSSEESTPIEEPILPSEIEDGLGLYRTSLGDYYLPLDAPHDEIINRMREGEVFETEIVDVAKRYIKEGTAVLDVGANFGQMTLLFSRLVGADGLVYGFEAQKKVFEVFKKNVEVSNARNIIPLFNAVSAESGKTLYFPEPNFTRFNTYGSYNLPLDATVGQEVSSLKIDDLCIEKPISLMKVDVQGHDLFAMQGATETIRKHGMPIIFEFEQQFQGEYGTSFQDYVDFVDAIGYRFVEVVLQRNYLIAA